MRQNKHTTGWVVTKLGDLWFLLQGSGKAPRFSRTDWSYDDEPWKTKDLLTVIFHPTLLFCFPLSLIFSFLLCVCHLNHWTKRQILIIGQRHFVLLDEFFTFLKSVKSKVSGPQRLIIFCSLLLTTSFTLILTPWPVLKNEEFAVIYQCPESQGFFNKEWFVIVI